MNSVPASINHGPGPGSPWISAANMLEMPCVKMQWNDLNWEGWAVSKVSLYYIIIEPGKIGGFGQHTDTGWGCILSDTTTDRAAYWQRILQVPELQTAPLNYFSTFFWLIQTQERLEMDWMELILLVNTKNNEHKRDRAFIIENIFNHHIFPNQTGQALCLLSYHSLQSLDVTVHFQPVIYPTKITYKNTIRVCQMDLGRDGPVTILKVSLFQIE